MDAPSMPPPPSTPAAVAGPAPAPPAGSSVADTPESKKRTRQPRNSACSACAALKMKCVRSVEGGTCERCNRMRLECLPSVPKPRKRREGEFITSLGSAPLSTSDAASSPFRDARTLPSPVSKPTSIASLTNASADSLLSRGDLHHTGSKSFTALLAQGLALESLLVPPSDLLTGIDANALVNACTVFRQYAARFPFVSIPLRIDAITMAVQRPMTALAVLTVTSAADPERQERSSHAFRLALGAKAIVNGERSVDILAGLLIYLAWNHHYMKKQQIYQHLYLLCGMTADLGLYDNPPRRDVKDAATATELDRAFVGAYFLCSLVSIYAFNKHCPMRWTENLRTCADNIAQAGEMQSDRLLASLLELAAAVDDLQTVMQASVKLSASRQHTELQAKTAGQRLRALKRDHAPLANSPTLAGCLIDAQYKQIHYNDNPDPSIMIQCACSAKEYFDDILSKPPAFLHQLAITDWILILHIAVIMSRLSKQAASATGWEHGALTSMLQPEQTMERLLNHMASAPMNDPLAPNHRGLLDWLHQFVQNSKDVILANDPGPTTRPAEGFDGRFRPMNSEALPLSSRSLPYQSQEAFAKSPASAGVLDPRFWTQTSSAG